MKVSMVLCRIVRARRSAAPALAALALAVLCASCVAGRDDALEMRDENLYDDLAEVAEARTDDEYEPRKIGARLRDWVDTLEASDTVTLAECFRLALNSNEELLLQGERLFQTWTQEREAISSLLPTVSFNGSYLLYSDSVKFGGSTVSPRDSAEYWFTLRQTLFDGQSFAAVSAAREAAKIERLTLHDRRDRLLYTVAAAFYEILGRERDVQVLEASLASAEEFLRVVEARWKGGEASRQEALLARAQRDGGSAELIQARHDLKIARTNLARLICLDVLPARLVDTYTLAFPSGGLPALKEAATVNRPDLEAARADIEFARAERQAAFADYLPRVYATLNRWLKREGAFNDAIDWDLSLNLTWDLFDSGGREARQARALSGIRQKTLTLNALERTIRQEVEEAVLSFESLEQQLGALKSRAEASKASLELADAEYQADEATNLDVQISRRTWEEAERDLARTELALKLAALKIQLVTGSFKNTEPLFEAVEIAGE